MVVASLAYGEKCELPEGSMNEPQLRAAFVGIAGLFAALTAIVGGSVALGLFESHVSGYEVPRALWGITGGSVGATILVGLSTGRRLPALGDPVVAIAALPLAAIMIWTIVLPVLWVLLVMLMLMKALRVSW
ncbi:MAG: hypothetical protein C1O27_002641 [Chloroflexi bacterium]|nr:MAG: hypothetical protein C1O27_002641 [Chloroflexota bacterium]